MTEHNSPLHDVNVATTDRTYFNVNTVELYDNYVHVWTNRHENDSPAEVIIPTDNVRRIEQ